MFLLDQNELVAKVFDGGVVEDEVRQGCVEGGCDHGPGVWESAGEQALHLIIHSVTGHQPSSQLHPCPGRAMRSASLLTRASRVTWRPPARS